MNASGSMVNSQVDRDCQHVWLNTNIHVFDKFERARPPCELATEIGTLLSAYMYMPQSIDRGVGLAIGVFIRPTLRQAMVSIVADRF